MRAQINVRTLFFGLYYPSRLILASVPGRRIGHTHFVSEEMAEIDIDLRN